MKQNTFKRTCQNAVLRVHGATGTLKHASKGEGESAQAFWSMIWQRIVKHKLYKPSQSFSSVFGNIR